MSDRRRIRRRFNNRVYDLYPAIAGTDPRPLAICLHGWGMRIAADLGDGGADLPGRWGEPFPQHTRLIERLDVHLAFPQADSRIEAQGLRHRNWREAPIDMNADAIFVAACLADARGLLGPRLGKTVLLGFSDGATLVDLVLRAFSGSFAAAVRHSGAINRSLRGTVGAAIKRPVYCVAGEGGWFSIERRMAAATREAERIYRAEGHRTELELIPGQGHAWAHERNGAFWDFLLTES